MLRKKRFVLGAPCPCHGVVMVAGGLKPTAYVKPSTGGVVCLRKYREMKDRLRAERGLPPVGSRKRGRPPGSGPLPDTHREKIRAAWARRRATAPAKPPKPTKPPKPETRAPEAVLYARVSVAAILSRGRWRGVILRDDGKGGRERRTSRRSFATSIEARAAAERMLKKSETQI